MDIMGAYILDENKQPILCDDINIYGKWFADINNRRVAKTIIGKVEISTVFLVYDHSFHLPGGGKPVLFETMIFGGKHNEYQERYCTWTEAEEGHKLAVAMVKKEK